MTQLVSIAVHLPDLCIRRGNPEIRITGRVPSVSSGPWPCLKRFEMCSARRPDQNGVEKAKRVFGDSAARAETSQPA